MMPVFYAFIYGLLTLFAGFALTEMQKFETPDSIAMMEVVEVADNVYVLHGLSGLPNRQNRGMIANLGFVVGDEGVIVIDSGSSGFHAAMLLDKIAAVTTLDVIAVFNTHIHGDHWLGNQVIAERFPEAKFYAHDRFIKLAKWGVGDDWVGILSRLTGADPSVLTPYIPTQPVADADSLRFGNVSVEVMHHAKAHTTTDIVLVIEQENSDSVVFLGDTGFFQRLGRMDDGSFKGNIEILEQAISLNADVYVPGHGPTTLGPHSAQAYLEYLELLYERTFSFYEAGIADFEIREKILPEFGQWQSWNGFAEIFGRHLSLVYLEIEEASF